MQPIFIIYQGFATIATSFSRAGVFLITYLGLIGNRESNAERHVFYFLCSWFCVTILLVLFGIGLLLMRYG